MDRRESLKAIALTTLATGLLTDACKSVDKKNVESKPGETVDTIDRMPEEKKVHAALTATRYFTPEEMAAITILCDIIIPADDISGSATDAKVPDFIEFIVKDKVEHQVPMRGGL